MLGVGIRCVQETTPPYPVTIANLTFFIVDVVLFCLRLMITFEVCRFIITLDVVDPVGNDPVFFDPVFFDPVFCWLAVEKNIVDWIVVVVFTTTRFLMLYCLPLSGLSQC